MQDCGALAPEKILEDEEFEGQEDMRGVENFLAWITGKANREIRRVALEGADAGREDYLAGMSRSKKVELLPNLRSSQKEAQHDGRRFEVYWNHLGQAVGASSRES